MELRLARTDDLPRLAPLWRAAWLDGHAGHVPDALMDARGPEHFAVHAEKYLASTVVAEEDGVLFGLIILGDEEGEVVQLAVDAAARGRGVGGALLRSAEERFTGRHPETWLAVVPGNERARRFYEFHGWRDAGPMSYSAPTAAGVVEVPVRRYVKALS
ncbi:GNAT family N-acetyltransferase [Actinomadura darangshiensis]|uniref:GNAT family N-acetyltransferase n=1 Tax=Actinomadura darangshiensis TaxID=705336 RepID=A0A4R5ALK5_9ACTN|nr:GNAT family N-acetyltransferase [Actinomadura darangshiensis]TDD73808.1 GNAT family N-acetyltransferase [Actinomadura darangshiensis]